MCYSVLQVLDNNFSYEDTDMGTTFDVVIRVDFPKMDALQMCLQPSEFSEKVVPAGEFGELSSTHQKGTQNRVGELQGAILMGDSGSNPDSAIKLNE